MGKAKIRERQVVQRKISELKPHPDNARTHSEAQVAKIVASLRTYGFTNPVLIDEADTILAGHARCLAAPKAGYVNAPCIVLAGLTEAQKRAYVIADNKLALEAGWDESMLAGEFMKLRSMDFDLRLTGFDFAEIDDILAGVQPGQAAVVLNSLAEKFGAPPFSVLDARQGYWQARKRAWLALGIKSELGRSDNTMNTSGVYLNQQKWRRDKKRAQRANGAGVR